MLSTSFKNSIWILINFEYNSSSFKIFASGNLFHLQQAIIKRILLFEYL